MKNYNLKITLTILFTLFYVSIYAQRRGGQRGGNRGGQNGGQQDAAQIFKKLDTNNDAKIDVDEASKAKRGNISQNFDNIDTNDDKFIDLAELEASLNGRARKKESAENIMKAADDNKDGKLNKLEIAAKEQLFLTNNFDAIDTNRDNEIDLEELKAYMAKSDTKKTKKRKKN
ncbi:EF-hand domain-containing protein [Aureibaculum sp. A20]|uniref:EF-hand domain-containing protein n=1 Tax=Aureibaculum flavum TaxID=2795986 RepID=A0ABS0WR48_9FLAO|nr:EF-hand domain-containing protein [Aureibaculum flavum]MBJ2174459.1 EF-hand domain-containing protein [Aureibaculum flavum]